MVVEVPHRCRGFCLDIGGAFPDRVCKLDVRKLHLVLVLDGGAAGVADVAGLLCWTGPLSSLLAKSCSNSCWNCSNSCSKRSCAPSTSSKERCCTSPSPCPVVAMARPVSLMSPTLVVSLVSPTLVVSLVSPTLLSRKLWSLMSATLVVSPTLLSLVSPTLVVSPTLLSLVPPTRVGGPDGGADIVHNHASLTLCVTKSIVAHCNVQIAPLFPATTRGHIFSRRWPNVAPPGCGAEAVHIQDSYMQPFCGQEVSCCRTQVAPSSGLT